MEMRDEDKGHYKLRDHVQPKNSKYWPPPASRDWKDSPGMSLEGTNPDGSKRTRLDQLARRGRGLNLADSVRLENIGYRRLSPAWVEWLMGWPISWTSLEPITELLWLDWSVDPADDLPPAELGRTPSPEEYILTHGGGVGHIPRVATGIASRVDRLKAIGNGQVPQVAAMAWEILTEGIG